MRSRVQVSLPLPNKIRHLQSGRCFLFLSSRSTSRRSPDVASPARNPARFRPPSAYFLSQIRSHTRSDCSLRHQYCRITVPSNRSNKLPPKREIAYPAKYDNFAPFIKLCNEGHPHRIRLRRTGHGSLLLGNRRRSILHGYRYPENRPAQTRRNPDLRTRSATDRRTKHARRSSAFHHGTRSVHRPCGRHLHRRGNSPPTRTEAPIPVP